MLFGTGLKIKTIEALAHGTALVSRTPGIEGLDPSEIANACIIADDAKSFAYSICKLLRSRDENERIRAAALDFHKRYLKTQQQNLASIFSQNSDRALHSQD
jgi:hypothetical protein